MADIEIKNKKEKHTVKTAAKKSTKVDLTPMVDLGFLLITFFVFTTAMSKPVVMELNTPDDTEGPTTDVCNSCALTVLLDKQDAIYWYEGTFENAALHKADYNSIRNIIQDKKIKVQAAGRKVEDFSLIIKSADSSSFRNFVDITDEVTINNIKRYYVDEMSAEEKIKMEQSYN